MTRIAVRVALNALASVALLLALEGASRLFWPLAPPDPLATPDVPEWKGTRMLDPLLFWQMRPGIERDGERFTNSLGLRGPEVPPPSEDEFRILSLGESSTFARRLRYDETYSKLVEDRLGTVDGKRVRVVNAGVPGYSLFQGVTYLQHRGLGLEPDAVLVYFGYNDALPVTRRGARFQAKHGDAPHTGSSATDRALFESLRADRTAQLGDWLLERSNLARVAASLRTGATGTFADPDTSRVPDADRRWLLDRALALSRESGVRLVVVVPWYRDFESHAALLREWAQAHDVTLIDLPRVLALPMRERGPYFVDPVHPNADGHDRIARAIADGLRQAWSSERSD